MSELFILYHTGIEKYYGRSVAMFNTNIRTWVDDVDDILPWTIKRLKHLYKKPLCNIFYDDDKIIVVPIDQCGYDFTKSIPLSQWSGWMMCRNYS